MLPSAPGLFSTMIVRPDHRPHLFGDKAHDYVGAAAGGKTADEMNILGRILLRRCVISAGNDGRDSDDRAEYANCG